MGMGRNIARVRREQSMTQKELAKKIGITREYLASVETDKEPISIRLLARIAEVLGVRIENLTED